LINAQAKIAEQLSIDHEFARLNKLGIDKAPDWPGLDDNYAGFDVLSYDPPPSAPTSRMIEVKSTTATPLQFIVTLGEWETALKFGEAYHFHIWDMSKQPPELHERTAAQIAPQIPTNNAKGRWKQAFIRVGGNSKDNAENCRVRQVVGRRNWIRRLARTASAGLYVTRHKWLFILKITYFPSKMARNIGNHVCIFSRHY
jgi:hypothetical protein